MRTLSFPLELDGNGELLVIEDLEALRQKVNQRLSLFKGTWIIDINAGVPYLQDILKKPVDPGLAASIIGNEILKEDEVTSLGQVTTDLDPETRVFTYTAQVFSIYSTTEPFETEVSI
jgi:hypothetical protein